MSDTVVKRVYCWRAGIAIEVADGEPCEECGRRDHKEVPPGTCGNFVEVNEEGGNPCVFPPNHNGKCGLDPLATVRYVIDE